MATPFISVDDFVFAGLEAFAQPSLGPSCPSAETTLVSGDSPLFEEPAHPDAAQSGGPPRTIVSLLSNTKRKLDDSEVSEKRRCVDQQPPLPPGPPPGPPSPEPETPETSEPNTIEPETKTSEHLTMFGKSPLASTTAIPVPIHGDHAELPTSKPEPLVSEKDKSIFKKLVEGELPRHKIRLRPTYWSQPAVRDATRDSKDALEPLMLGLHTLTKSMLKIIVDIAVLRREKWRGEVNGAGAIYVDELAATWLAVLEEDPVDTDSEAKEPAPAKPKDLPPLLMKEIKELMKALGLRIL
jgi:hypothetical protein